MTSRKDEINKLIADIDNLVTNTGNPLSKLLSGQGQEERDVLQRVRDFLIQLNKSETPEEIPPEQSQTPPLSSLLARYVEQNHNPSSSNSYQSQQLQTHLTPEQLKDEISVVLQPLQAELSSLLEERTSLVQEIRQLEQKRLQNYSLTQQLATQEHIIREFLQVLISRLVPNLIPYLTRNVPNSSSVTTGEHNQEASNSDIQTFLESVEGIERLANLTKELDQRLLSLDGTVNVIFSALERNIQTYYQSLSQALERMHSQGLQGEQLMANFLNHLHKTLQPQSPDAQSLTFGLDSGKEVQPVTSGAEELIQDRVTEETLEPEIVEDLDAVVLQLTTQQPPDSEVNTLVNTFISSHETQPEIGEELIQDRVTQETPEPEIVEDLDAVVLQLTTQQPPDSVVDTLVDTFISSHETQPEIGEELIQDRVTEETPEPEIVQDLDVVLLQLTTQQPPDSVVDTLVDTFISSHETQPEIGEELIQDKVTEETPEPEIVQDLDAVLLQLRSENPATSVSASFSTPDESQAESIDEVDTLYANLFGGADEITSKETTIETTIESEGTREENNRVEKSETPESPKNPQPQENKEQDISEAVEQSQEKAPEKAVMVEETIEPVSSEIWEKTLLPEDTQSQAEFASIPTLLNLHPDISDTITVLTDLLVDVNGEENVTETSAVDNHPDTVALEIPIVSSLEESDIQNLGSGYILGSPLENLLSLDNTDIEIQGIPNIVLDESQLQQLDRDSANFDWRLNSGEEQTSSVESLRDSEPDNQETGMLHIESPSSTVTENIPLAAVSNPNNLQSQRKQEVTNSPLQAAALGHEKLSDNSSLRVNDSNFVWYLGIDLGTTGISAALLNRSQLVVYPIYWSAENPSGNSAFEQSFRLPAEVYLPTASIPISAKEGRDNIEQTAVVDSAQDKTRATTAPKQHLYSAHLKPFLHIGIPYKNKDQKWEPVLQLNEFSAGPLIWVVRSLSKLLLTIRSDQTSTTPALTPNAVGIDTQVFPEIINNIAGVVCSCPSSWSEQYRFNVREAILASHLVSHPQQIFFVEEAIASLLPELNPSNSQGVQLHDNQGLHPLKTSENFFIGTTLTLNIGATATDMALVDLPTDLSQLKYRDFMLHSFAYGGKAMEQDIICQLLLPPKSRQPRGKLKANSHGSTNNPWHWQPSIPGLDQIEWSSLGLSNFGEEALEIPRVGEPDILTRIRLQQKLESSLLGQGLFDAALALKLILQHQESFTLELADQCWTLQRRDLETQVFVPYIRRFNRELNKLLVARGIPTEAVDQVIISGGVASIPTINRWLRQKLPNAKIIQDLYLGEKGAPKCSRVAYGLATLPLYPQVLEIPKQQYTDYFLFSELLKILPDNSGTETMRSLSFGEVLQLFESRGINTRVCQQRLLAFLEGELPAGLIPTIAAETLPELDDKHLPGQTLSYSLWLAKTSQENPDYQAIASTPLFQKQGNLTYRPNSQQLLLLRRYLDAIKASSLQSLEEPLAVNFVSNVS